MSGASASRRQAAQRRREERRREYSFFLDADLVERARREVGEADVTRSIEAALVAAIDYRLWLREVSTGAWDPRA